MHVGFRREMHARLYSPHMSAAKVGRNTPCPCGSGLKYKRCCLAAEQQTSSHERLWQGIQRAHEELAVRLIRFARRTLAPELIEEARREFYVWSDAGPGVDEKSLEVMFQDWLFYRFVPDPLERRSRAIELPGVPIVRSFLRSESARLSDLERGILRAGQRRGNSLYAVRSIQAEGRLGLYDLLTQEELCVTDREASRHAQVGMVLFAHVLPLDAMAHFGACAGIPLPARSQLAVLDARQDLPGARDGVLDPRALTRADLEIRDLYFELLRRSSPAARPRLCNPDGEPLVPITLYFDLECSAEQAFQALAGLSGNRHPRELVHHTEGDARGALVRARLDWIPSVRPGQPIGAAPTLGTIEIDAAGARILASVDSQERAEALRREIEKRLPGGARFEREVRDSIEPPEPAGGEGGARAQLDLFQDGRSRPAREDWPAWLDAPNPLLHELSPREAAATPPGRERLRALLDDAGSRGPDASLPLPDPTWIRAQLDVTI